MGLSKTFANNMRHARNELGLNQDDFGDLCGLTRNHVGTIERCEHSPTLHTMIDIANALGVEVVDLLQIKP